MIYWFVHWFLGDDRVTDEWCLSVLWIMRHWLLYDCLLMLSNDIWTIWYRFVSCLLLNCKWIVSELSVAALAVLSVMIQWQVCDERCLSESPVNFEWCSMNIEWLLSGACVICWESVEWCMSACWLTCQRLKGVSDGLKFFIFYIC
jgi:hypothetical protein